MSAHRETGSFWRALFGVGGLLLLAVPGFAVGLFAGVVWREPTLVAKQAVSQRELDDALAQQDAASSQVDAAKAAVEKARLDLTYTRITAPISGLVGATLVKAGNHSSTAALSRDHTITISKSGLLTIAGGKWTTYRKMAEDCVDHASVLARLDQRIKELSRSNRRPLCALQFG